jgi:hypothetical protein
MKLVITQLVMQFPTFMEPEGSLPYSQDPTSGPYSDPNESIPHLPTLLP